nr:hypothetical protein [Tanacetum cinerariifolium]
MCLVFGHSVEDCPKAPKRVVNMVDKGKGGSSRADDDGFIEDCPKAPKRVVNMVDKGKGGSSRADDDGFIEVKKKKSRGARMKQAKDLNQP